MPRPGVDRRAISLWMACGGTLEKLRAPTTPRRIHVRHRSFSTWRPQAKSSGNRWLGPLVPVIYNPYSYYSFNLFERR